MVQGSQVVGRGCRKRLSVVEPYHNTSSYGAVIFFVPRDRIAFCSVIYELV
jgi:hypothetical protein